MPAADAGPFVETLSSEATLICLLICETRDFVAAAPAVFEAAAAWADAVGAVQLNDFVLVFDKGTRDSLPSSQ